MARRSAGEPRTAAPKRMWAHAHSRDEASRDGPYGRCTSTPTTPGRPDAPGKGTPWPCWATSAALTRVRWSEDTLAQIASFKSAPLHGLPFVARSYPTLTGACSPCHDVTDPVIPPTHAATQQMHLTLCRPKSARALCHLLKGCGTFNRGWPSCADWFGYPWHAFCCYCTPCAVP